jgi:hypothetical protein
MIADKETHDNAYGRDMVGIEVPEINDVRSDTFLLALVELCHIHHR